MDEASFQQIQPLMEDLGQVRNSIAQLRVMREQWLGMMEVMTPPHRLDYKLERDYTHRYSAMSHPGIRVILDLSVFRAMRGALNDEEDRLMAALRKLGMDVEERR